MMDENECMVLGCSNKKEVRVQIGQNKILHTCKECAENIKHPEKLSVEPLD